MNILALETSTDLASVALQWNGQLTSLQLQSPPAHSATLLPAVRRLMDEAGASFKGLDRIACGTGPGSFTGVRLACSVAQGLALAAGCGIVPVCSLLALAEGSGFSEVYCAMDARMSEVYVAAYRASAAGWQEVVAPCCVPPAATPFPGTGDWHGVGTAFSAYPSVMEGSQAWLHDAPVFAQPDAAAVLALARIGAAIDPAGLTPLYVRDRVAQTIAERLAAGGRA